MEKIYEAIKQEATKYNIAKIVLFGSRARGDNKPRSDIDLAIYGSLTKREKYDFDCFIKEKTPTLLEFDIVFITDKTSAELIKNIENDGVLLYEKIR